MKSSTLALGLTGKAGYLGLLCTKGAGVGIYYSQTVPAPSGLGGTKVVCHLLLSAKCYKGCLQMLKG